MCCRCNGFRFLELGVQEYSILLRPSSDTAQAGMGQERPPVWSCVLSHWAPICQALGVMKDSALQGIVEGLLTCGVWEESCRSS